MRRLIIELGIRNQCDYILDLCNIERNSLGLAKEEKIKLNRLKQVLAALDISQKDFGEKTGYSANTVSRWCSNQQQPSLETLYEIALILKIDVRRLIVSTPDQIKLDDEI